MTRLGPALLFIAVILVIIPRAVVFGNLADIGPVVPYIYFSALASAITLILAFASIRLLSDHRAQFVARLMFATALFVLV